MTKSPIICFVTAGGHHPWIIANALAARFGDALALVEEEPESKWRLLQRRARKLGWLNAVGQLGTMAIIRLGKVVLGPRIRRYVRRQRLEVEPPRVQRTIAVPSVNSDEFVLAIADLKPDLIFLAGCRLMAKRTLSRMPCPVINYHAGITPKYRGMNGGYWALARGEPDQFGSTIHMVDEGIDTGPVLRQVRCRPEPGDSIITYAYTLAAASRSACVNVVEDVLAGRMDTLPALGLSQQWYHPPIWTYLWIGLTARVW
ncbi:MAG TPA: formyl transferase [Rhizobiales bacterium]|nr:formyl transferase [Hyphomicrobiales bacterium]